MNKRLLFFTAALYLGGVLAPPLACVMAQPQVAPEGKAQSGKKKQTNASNSQQEQNEGQRIFEQNCSRCHNAPEGFSPNISGTIVRHMRVRASLSKHDEEELLRFFNP
jgi:mono/diheme cytochrome c family protein